MRANLLFHVPPASRKERLHSLMTILVAQPSLKGPWVSAAQGGDPAVSPSPQLFSSWQYRWKRICLQCRRPVRSLGWEDPLEKGMTTHSSILARRIPWTEEPDGLQSMGSQLTFSPFAALQTSELSLEAPSPGCFQVWQVAVFLLLYVDRLSLRCPGGEKFMLPVPCSC